MSYIPKQLVLLSSQTASNSASIIFNSSVVNSSYTKYYLEVRNYVPATNNEYMLIYFSTDNGSTYLANGVYSSGVFGDTGAGPLWQTNNNTPFLTLLDSVNPNSGTGNQSQVTFFNLGSASLSTFFVFDSVAITGGNNAYIKKGGGSLSTTSLNAIKVQAFTGNITSGNFYFYGVVEP